MSTQTQTQTDADADTNPVSGAIGWAVGWVKFLVLAFILWAVSMGAFAVFRSTILGGDGNLAIFAIWLIATALATHVLGWFY